MEEVEVYAYRTPDGWYFSENIQDDCSVLPEKVSITLLPDTDPDTERRLHQALQSGLTAQTISDGKINQ